MKTKFGLFILIFVVVLLIPTTVFAQNQKNCDKYTNYRWYGYTIVSKGEKDEEINGVDGNTSIRDYFNNKFANGDLDAKSISGIWLFFSDSNGNQYSSKASVTRGKYIQCTGKVTLIEGATVDPPGGEGDEETISAIQTYHCRDLENTEMYTKVLNPAYKFIRIAVPSLLVLLCSYDFMAAVVANDQDKMKKAQARVLKRIAVGIIIFLLPNLMNALLNLVGNYGTCGVGL